MKKIKFTKKSIFLLIIVSIICLLIEPIGYYNIYLNPLDVTWRRIILRLIGVVVLLSGKFYFPDRPESLRKWLYFMAIAFFSKVLGQLIFKIYANTPVILLFYTVATIFFILSLLIAIAAYKNIHSPRGIGTGINK